MRDMFNVIIRDVTERKQAEKELRRVNAQLESLVEERTVELRANLALMAAIFDSTVDAMLTVDETGLIQSANRAARRMFGYRERDLLGMHLENLVSKPPCPSSDTDIVSFLKRVNE